MVPRRQPRPVHVGDAYTPVSHTPEDVIALRETARV